MEQPDQQKFDAISARPRLRKTPRKDRTDVSRQHSEHSTVPIGRSFKGLTDGKSARPLLSRSCID